MTPIGTACIITHYILDLNLKNVILKGDREQFAFATRKDKMSFGYNFQIENCQIYNFRSILKAYKGSFADTLFFLNTKMKDCWNGLELAAETDDLGDYNAEFVNIINCEFENIQRSCAHS